MTKEKYQLQKITLYLHQLNSDIQNFFSSAQPQTIQSKVMAVAMLMETYLLGHEENCLQKFAGA